MHALIPAFLACLPAEHARRPLLVADALAVVEGVSSGFASGDFDGDGVADLVVCRPSHPHAVVRRLDAVSVRTGETIRTLWTETRDVPLRGWGVGEDLDGDGCPDLVLANPEANRHAGAVRVVSGLDGALLARIDGAAPYERLGQSVAFVGDWNGDGLDDYADGTRRRSASCRAGRTSSCSSCRIPLRSPIMPFPSQSVTSTAMAATTSGSPTPTST